MNYLPGFLFILLVELLVPHEAIVISGTSGVQDNDPKAVKGRTIIEATLKQDEKKIFTLSNWEVSKEEKYLEESVIYSFKFDLTYADNQEKKTVKHCKATIVQKPNSDDLEYASAGRPSCSEG